jgi:hypothetical protein
MKPNNFVIHKILKGAVACGAGLEFEVKCNCGSQEDLWAREEYRLNSAPIFPSEHPNRWPKYDAGGLVGIFLTGYHADVDGIVTLLFVCDSCILPDMEDNTNMKLETFTDPTLIRDPKWNSFPDLRIKLKLINKNVALNYNT